MSHSRKLIPAKSLVKLNSRIFISAKSLINPNSRKLSPAKCPKKNLRKLILAKISSLSYIHFGRLSSLLTTFTLDHVQFGRRSHQAFTLYDHFRHLGLTFTLDVYFGSILIIVGVRNMQHDRCGFY